VRDGRLTKAVIAREICVSSDEPIDIHAVLVRLRMSFGSSYRYSIDGFVGAMPELLVSVHGNTVQAHPFAGTTPRTGEAAKRRQSGNSPGRSISTRPLRSPRSISPSRWVSHSATSPDVPGTTA